MLPPKLPAMMPCPIPSPIPGAIVVFVIPRHLTSKSAPCVTKSVHCRTQGGLPLLRLALPPAVPLEVGVVVYARMVGPLEGGDPMNRSRTSKDVGIEGRIVAARYGQERGEVEFVVRNESWSLAPYASILVRVESHFPVTVSRAQEACLLANAESGPTDRSLAHKPVMESAKFVPGTGPRDAAYLYLVPGTHRAQDPPFREQTRQSRALEEGRAIREITSALGYGWTDRLERS